MRLTRLTSLTAIAALATALILANDASAAPVVLQDYEAPGNLDAPFNLPPDFSGTTVGVDAATDTITHVPADGAVGTAASAELFIPHNAAESPTAAGWAWQVRFLPNSGGSTNAQNPLFAPDGYVGYFLKVDPAVTADMQTAPVLEDSTGTGTATSGILRAVIKDGQWYRYQWNMDDPGDFPGSFNTVYAGGLGNTTLEAMNSFDSIAIVSSNGGNATVRVDQIGYDNAGPLVPEPASLVLWAFAGLSAWGSFRQRAI
jgi:hypothetical protein